MKLLVIQPTGDKRGHYGIYTVKLCQAAARLGHEVTLCTNRAHVSRYLQDEPAFRLLEVGNGSLGFERFDAAIEHSPLYYYWGYFRNSYAITKAGIQLSRREPFDGIAILDAEFMTASLLLQRRGRVTPPVVMLLWATNFAFADYPGPVYKRAYKVLQREVFRRTLGRGVQALAVLDEWHRDRLRPQLRLSADFPIAVIPDGGEDPLDTPTKSAARRTLGLIDQGPVFLFFGVLRKDKGIEYLLDAMSRVAPDAEQMTLVLAGWPMEYTAENVARMVARYGLTERVLLKLAYVPDEMVPAYFAACDALVLPYARTYTGGSGPLMKGACTYRRPVIATRVSGMGQLVEQHRIGLVAEPEDAGSLAEKMRQFLALSEAERLEMADNAAALARANSWDVLASRLVALIRAVSQPK